MEIQKLKKQLLKEEIRRQRRNSRFSPRLISGVFLLLVLLFAAGWYAVGWEGRQERLFDKAEEYFQGGQYEKAVHSFHRLYEKHPENAKAAESLYRSGDILNLYLNKYHEAILAFLLVARDYDDQTWAEKAQFQVADIYKNRLRDYPKAIVAYQKLLDRGVADSDRIQYEIGDAYFRLNNYEQARIEFESLVKSYPESNLVPEVKYRIALAYSLEGQLKKAEKTFREVSEAYPDDPFAVEARFGLATVLEEQERLRESLTELQKLKGVYPKEDALTKRISQVEERIRKKKKAI
ncbi:MAG: tetratricopeptide repeat protein [Desulfuromonadales bacterium]|nr:tetratricopeptide repeat protein [Desulfuromonadales bacterium]